MLAGDALQIVEQLAIDPMLGTGSNVVGGFDEKVDQVIGQRPAAQMNEGRKPCEPGRLRGMLITIFDQALSRRAS